MYLFVPTDTTVDPTVVSQELVDLKSGTWYTVQISAFTSAGVGVTSGASYFETHPQGSNAKHNHQTKRFIIYHNGMRLDLYLSKERSKNNVSP